MTEALQEVILDVGYIEPGHGLKGRQVWLVEDDMIEMYSRFKKRQCITLWCFVRKPDQPCTNSSPKCNMPAENVTPQSKRGRCEQTISEVEDIVKKLEEKHGEVLASFPGLPRKRRPGTHCLRMHGIFPTFQEFHITFEYLRVSLRHSRILLHNFRY